MKFDLQEAIAILERTPRVLDLFLRDLPRGWVLNAAQNDDWSPFDILGHFIHGEKTDWMPRARIILEHGESRPFVPFDRFAQFSESEGKTLEQLLDEFVALRQANLAALRVLQLQETDLARTGQHPELGVVTLGQLLATWVAHDLDHLKQMARVMTKQYQTEVGPWGAYIGGMTE